MEKTVLRKFVYRLGQTCVKIIDFKVSLISTQCIILKNKMDPKTLVLPFFYEIETTALVIEKSMKKPQT